MLLDSHCHLSDEKYGSARTLIDNFNAEGGKYLLDVGYDYPSSVRARENAHAFDGVYFTAGFHPDTADKNNDIGLIAQLLTDERCVAVGEVGLDHHYEPYDKVRQEELFVKQIVLAKEFSLPVVIHSRDASENMHSVLTAHKDHLKSGFLMHCYSESKEQAKKYLDLGAYFAFGGVITFKNAKKDEIIRYIPTDRLLPETDSPYMSPVPKRNERNEPAFIRFVYDKFAEILKTDREKLEETFFGNFKTFFKKVGL